MSASPAFKSWLQARAQEVDRALKKSLPAKTVRPQTVHAAMAHSMFAGGKRLRPILCLSAAEACGAQIQAAMPAACAVEFLHTYSLIHDDLPCMDDDDFRRGVPTCHKVYGDAIAVLAGDALQAQAFLVLAALERTKRYGHQAYLTELAETAGSRKLIGGQVLDIEGEGKKLDARGLKAIHENKTGALLTTSVRLGGMSANATPKQLETLTTYGKSLGLAFQIIDDILDITQSSEQLGKSAGKDQAVGKATYPAVHGMAASRKEAARLTEKARKAAASFGKKGEHLLQLADYLLDREY